jgi:hypothetical protein
MCTGIGTGGTTTGTGATGAAGTGSGAATGGSTGLAAAIGAGKLIFGCGADASTGAGACWAGTMRC